jgi:hypothetical protein
MSLFLVIKFLIKILNTCSLVQIKIQINFSLTKTTSAILTNPTADVVVKISLVIAVCG